MDINALKEAGFTEGEIKVYLALLDLGDTTTGPIIEKSKISKSIVYQILNKLLEKGVVSIITREKTKHFQAANPERILDYIDEREIKLKETKKKIQKILPQLIAKQKSGDETKVKVFEGFKGMITAHTNLYNKVGAGEDVYYMGVSGNQPKYMHAYWLKDHRRREKLKIHFKALFQKGTNRKQLDDRNKFKYTDTRYMPIDINTPAWFFGYKDVAVIGLPAKKPISIEITNTEIADSFKAYFYEFWNKSEPLR